VTSESIDHRLIHTPLVAPTLRKQCEGFMIGSALFALGSAPGLGSLMGASIANLMFFVGAWFFTAAGLVQLFLSGPVSMLEPRTGRPHVRAEWLSSATQTFGTLLFNVSTAAALQARTAQEQDRWVWTPDAAGSVAFLVSGILAVVAYSTTASLGDAKRRAWWSTMVNLLGCIAFGVSAVGAFVVPDGAALSASAANGGTFVGAVCFFVASAVMLPRGRR
jgi:hypothetical protein